MEVFASILKQITLAPDSLEVKTLRLVCHEWKREVDTYLLWLKPRQLKVLVQPRQF